MIYKSTISATFLFFNMIEHGIRDQDGPRRKSPSKNCSLNEYTKIIHRKCKTMKKTPNNEEIVTSNQNTNTPRHIWSTAHYFIIIWSLTPAKSFFFPRLQAEIPVRLPKVLQSFQLFSSKWGQSWNQSESGFLCFLPCFFPPLSCPCCVFSWELRLMHN